MYQGCTVTKTSHLPIRYFLALLWAHPILHISTIRVKLLMFQACLIRTTWAPTISLTSIRLNVTTVNHPSESNSWSVSQTAFRMFWKVNAHHRVPKSPPLVSTMGRLSTDIFTYFFYILLVPFIFFRFHFYHCIPLCGCMFCMLLFNFVNYVFLLLCLCILIVMFMYSYCYLRSILCILFHCVFLCVVCV